MHSTTRAVSVLVLAGATLGLVAIAGPIDPPSGPVSRSYRTLDEVEPRVPIGPETTPGDADSVFRIVEPGSYYLTENIVGESGKHGIEVAADNVTIDLMGFELRGVRDSLDGVVVAEGGFVATAVLNGAAAGWGGTGFDLASGDGARLRDLRAVANGEQGIDTGLNAVVTGCTVLANGRRGIQTGSWATVTDCTASGNGTSGFGGGRTVNYRGCVSTDNLGDGFGLGLGSMIVECSTESNGDAGIALSRECTARGNSCLSNAVGIRTGYGNNRIENNFCTQNSVGFHITTERNFLTGNTASINGLNWDVVGGNAGHVVHMKLGGGFRGDEGGTSPGPAEPGLNYSLSL